MRVDQFQHWLNDHGAAIAVDGKAGAQTQSAMLSVFANPNAPAISEADLSTFARRLGGTPEQLRAVAAVESGGEGFDLRGRPKILWERHHFWKRTAGAFGLSWFSNPTPGDYTNDSNRNGISDSWEKLCQAAAKDPLKAFESCSWGKFQVMGFHATKLGYENAIEMAWSLTRSEAAHYELLMRFIQASNLTDAFRSLSTTAADCQPFARGYNGPGFARFAYDAKIAAAVARQA